MPIVLEASYLLPLFLAVLFFALAPSGAASRPNILLITLDTTRADRLGCYGYRSALTPALDALAAHGTLFEQAFTSCPMTLPAHATMLTGLDPPEPVMDGDSAERMPVRELGGQSLEHLLRHLLERLVLEVEDVPSP